MKRIILLLGMMALAVTLYATNYIPITLSCGYVYMLDTEKYPNMEEMMKDVRSLESVYCSGKDIDEPQEPEPDPEPNPSDV